MQSSLAVRMTEGRQAHGWLHKATGSADTLILIVHGHNSHGDRSRFITLARWFEHSGKDCLRWNAVRKDLGENTREVLTATEEYEQVKALVDSMRRTYKQVIAIGHSQGGLLALRLCAEKLADTYVSLMGVGDTIQNVEDKKRKIGVLDTSGKQNSQVTLPTGETFVYPSEFFTDLATWNVPNLLSHHHGPSLFVAGARDTSIPPSEVEAAFNHARQPKKLITVDDVHNFSDETARLLAHAIRDWLETEQK